MTRRLFCGLTPPTIAVGEAREFVYREGEANYVAWEQRLALAQQRSIEAAASHSKACPVCQQGQERQRLRLAWLKDNSWHLKPEEIG